jgi:hypothetical protein
MDRDQSFDQILLGFLEDQPVIKDPAIPFDVLYVFRE